MRSHYLPGFWVVSCGGWVVSWGLGVVSGSKKQNYFIFFYVQISRSNAKDLKGSIYPTKWNYKPKMDIPKHSHWMPSPLSTIALPS